MPLRVSINFDFHLRKNNPPVGCVMKWNVACKVFSTKYFQNSHRNESVIWKSDHVTYWVKISHLLRPTSLKMTGAPGAHCDHSDYWPLSTPFAESQSLCLLLLDIYQALSHPGLLTSFLHRTLARHYWPCATSEMRPSLLTLAKPTSSSTSHTSALFIFFHSTFYPVTHI